MVSFGQNFPLNRISLSIITNDACIVINCYCDCLNCDRSAVHVRLGNFGSALQDIELALKVTLFTVPYIPFHNLQKLVSTILELLKQVCPIEYSQDKCGLSKLLELNSSSFIKKHLSVSSYM